MADGNIIRPAFRSRPRDAHPMSPCPYLFPAPEPVEPEPAFRVDRKARCVVWEANGLKLFHTEQFRVLAGIFAENGWRRHFLDLGEAELALTAPECA